MRAENLRERADFDRVAERRAGAVAFDVIDRVGADARHRLRHGDDLGLAADAGGGVADFHRAVVVERRAADDRADRVAIGQGRGQALQDDDADAFAADDSLGRGVEGAAVAVGERINPAGR